MVNALPPGGPLEPGGYRPLQRGTTLRDMLRPLFRYRRAVVGAFVMLAAATITAAALAERTYRSEMKILVKRERFDPGITGDVQPRLEQTVHVTESELYAEMELLTSRDLLEKTALASGLDKIVPPERSPEGDPRTAYLSRLERTLRRHLAVQPIKKTTVIRVAYSAPDPKTAVAVLTNLASLYLDKHLAIHRPPGAYQFFTEQADRFERELHEAEARRNAFTDREKVVSASRETDAALTKLAEFEAELQTTEANIADATRRQATIREELAKTPDRQVTQIRNEGGIEYIRGLKSQLLQLELKRSDLLQKFTPQYPLVIEVDTELAQVRKALADAEGAPLAAQTTDANPTHQWLRNEAARVQTEKDALGARAASLRRTIDAYSAKARRLDSQGVEQQELLRAVKEAEENYTLYRHKQEEARISDALDRTRVANVTIADPPSIPSTASSYAPLILAAGGVLSIVLSIALAYFLNAIDPRFRTPDEVYQVLEVPVLAALPAPGE